MQSRFCPKCGTKKGSFIGNFCVRCYLEDNPVVQLPRAVGVECCKKCGKVRWKGAFLEQSEELLRRIVEANAKVSHALENPKLFAELSPQGNGTTEAKLTVNALLCDTSLSISANTTLKPRNVLCDPCMKLSSSYYQAVLQLRYPKTPSQRQLSAAEAEVESAMRAEFAKDSLAVVVQAKSVPKGIDFLIGSKHAAKAAAKNIARKHDSKITHSYSTVGMTTSGKEKKRYTFCVRMH